MSAAELDRVAALARLMRQAYPGRSETYCIQRSAMALRDVAAALAEWDSARRCGAMIAAQDGSGHQDRATLDGRRRALEQLGAEMAGIIDDEVRCVVAL